MRALPERPEWVRAINAGEILPIAEEAALPLQRAHLIAEALARMGHARVRPADWDRALGRPGFPAEPALERLERLLEALRDEARLSRMGRFMTRRFLLRLIEVRFQLMQYLDADPAVEDECIRAPLFVAGAPRTGTTILHRLLAADARHRVPLGWELLRPVPPPLAADPESDRPPQVALEDPRIALADRELVLPQTVVSGLLAIHEYGGRRPKECLSAMSLAFQSEEFTARHFVPSFERVLAESDMRDAYRMHKLVLQVRQRHQPDTAWVLKSPVHLHTLPTLFETYPDARVAITHRDPLTLLASLTHLIANLRWAHSDHVDPEAIAASHIERYRTTFEHLVDWTQKHEIPLEQIHHSHFGDFLRQPLETVERLYIRFGLDFGEVTRHAMQAALDAHPADRHGAHVYSHDDLFVSPSRLRPDFARYQAAFEVANDD